MTSTRVSVIATFKSFSYGVRGVPFFFSKKCRTRWPDSPAPPEGKSLVFSLFLRVWWRDVVVHQRREGRKKLKEASRSQKLIKSISVEMDLRIDGGSLQPNPRGPNPGSSCVTAVPRDSAERWELEKYAGGNLHLGIARSTWRYVSFSPVTFFSHSISTDD